MTDDFTKVDVLVAADNVVSSLIEAFKEDPALEPDPYTYFVTTDNITHRARITTIEFNEDEGGVFVHCEGEDEPISISDVKEFYGNYGCELTSIGDDAFAGNSNLISITIPSSVTNIGVAAFANCSGLTSVTIPDSVTSIGVWAFRDCSGLTSITINKAEGSITGAPWGADPNIIHWVG